MTAGSSAPARRCRRANSETRSRTSRSAPTPISVLEGRRVGWRSMAMSLGWLCINGLRLQEDCRPYVRPSAHTANSDSPWKLPSRPVSTPRCFARYSSIGRTGSDVSHLPSLERSRSSDSAAVPLEHAGHGFMCSAPRASVPSDRMAAVRARRSAEAISRDLGDSRRAVVGSPRQSLESARVHVDAIRVDRDAHRGEMESRRVPMDERFVAMESRRVPMDEIAAKWTGGESR